MRSKHGAIAHTFYCFRKHYTALSGYIKLFCKRFISGHCIDFIGLFEVVLCFSDLFESSPTVVYYILIGQFDIFIYKTMIDRCKYLQSIIVQVRLTTTPHIIIFYCRITYTKWSRLYFTLET